MGKQAHTPQLLSLWAAMKIQCSQKEKKKKNIFSKHRGHMCKYRGQEKTWHFWGNPNI